MEQKIKTQYSYFIYPFIVDEKNYESYILNLLENKNCRIKYWNKENDLSIYTYLNKTIRDNLFWSFDFSDEKKQKLNSLDNDLKSKLLSQYETIFFEYYLGKNSIQGKIGESGTELFDINKIDIICFKSGICFLIIKTSLGKECSLHEIISFNNKMRTLGSDFKTTTDEEIRIQIDNLTDVFELSKVFKNITNLNKDAKTLKLLEERILTYSYVCLNESNEDNEESFTKFYKVLSNETDVIKDDEKNKNILNFSKNLKIGFSKQGTGILSKNENPANSLKWPYAFEQEYLYTYILCLYKKIYLNKINSEYNETKKFEKAKEKLEKFTDKIWVYSITKDENGANLNKKWEEILHVQYLYEKLKLNMMH